MKRSLRTALIAGVLTALAFGGLYEYSSHVGRGWWRGEATFEGRPTSYWRAVVEDDLRCDPRELYPLGARAVPDDGWQAVKERLHLHSKRRTSLALANWWDSMTDVDGNPSPRAKVLQELADDPNEKIAGFARDAAKLTVTWAGPEHQWGVLLEKYSLRTP